MTHSTVRLWDHGFAFLAGEAIPKTEIHTTDERIRIEHKWHGAEGGPLAAGFGEVLKQRLRNLYITIDPDPNRLTFVNRRGGIVDRIEITEQECPCGHCGVGINTLLIEVIPNPTELSDPPRETVYPPRGYGIGLPGSGDSDHAIIGCWATEQEARAAIADLRIVALGDARPSWDTGR